LDVSLVGLSKGQYASTIVMSTKKDVFGNWTKHRMCEDYHPMSKQTHSNKYSMPLLEDIFYALAQLNFFSNSGLQYG
jgi:hypothetical protein